MGTGVALLQLSFWPSREIFCLRLRGGPSGPDRGELPPGLRILLARGQRGEAAIVGFALGEDMARLGVGHGLRLEQSAAFDLQPQCSRELKRLPGVCASLKDSVYRLLGEDIDKGQQCSDWEGPLSQGQLRYAADDAWWTMRLFGQLPFPKPVKNT